jgi:hypothetical protein
LILCEGLDAKLFLIHYINYVFGEEQIAFQVDDFGGITELKNYIKVLPNLSGFVKTKSIVIIRDAESDAIGASQSICGALKRNGFAVPDEPCVITAPKNSQYKVKVAYALFPLFTSISKNGTLEDLCLEMLSHPKKDNILSISDYAVSSVTEQVGELRLKHKNRLHTYLSLTDVAVGLKIGESAKANMFDLEAKAMSPLRYLLESVCHL